MLKKTLFYLGVIMLGLVLAAPQPLPASSGGQHGAEQEYTGESSADKIQVKNVSSHGSGAASHEAAASHGSQASHASSPAASGGQAQHGSQEAGQVEVKAIPVTLADAATLDILRSDWLKEAHAAETNIEDSGLSATFWVMIAALAGLVVLVAVFMAGGIFKRFSLNIKLYAGFGCLIVLAAVLGLSGFLYLSSVMRLGHLEAQTLELDMMSSEVYVAQNEFLLHGIENRAYGDRQVEKVNELVAEFSNRMTSIYKTAGLDDGFVKSLENIEKDVQSYKHEFQEVVKAFHEVEVNKEKLDEVGEKVDEALAEMFHHHEAELARLEAKGAAMNEIAYQSLLISHLVEAQILSLKLAHNEVEFLLDKHADRVPAMEREMGLLKGYLKALKEELQSAEEKNRISALEKEVENYAAMLTRVVRDEAVIMKNTAGMRGLLHEINAAGFAMAKRAEHMADAMEKEADTAQIVLIAAVLVLGLVLSTVIARGISNPVNRIIAGLKEGAEQVASAAGQVSQSSQSLAEGSSEQAASIEETSASLEEMSSMTKQNADHAGQADSLMQDANQVVTQANQSMTALTGSMAEISSASEETSKIIKTIDEIAFQTNLLALNAAVEAARAGEAGAGFAVVADEVRNLAMRAADAAKNTADLIEGTVKKVNDGSELVTKTNDAFTEVAASAAKVGELVAEIAAASNEQAQGITQVNTAVSEMDKVTQSNAANAEESASASEEMSAQAEQMQAIVEDLVALVSGSKNGAGNGAGNRAAPPTRASRELTHKHVPQPVPMVRNQASHESGKVSPEQFIPLDDDIKGF